ncbi:MAG: phage portal protein [Dehalococcoidales bacterium]|nr:phage portal protein [Dehalococcoidales bacterium]
MKENFKPGELVRRDTDRIRRYRELLDFYQGTQWQGREKPGEKHLIFNYARVVVDKISSYLMSGVKFVVDPSDDSPEARKRARRAEDALHRVYDENGLEQLDFETEVDCAVLGDAVYKVIWDTEMSRVRVTAPDIQGIYVWSGGDDASKVWRIASRYVLDSDVEATLHGIKPKGKTAVVVELWTAGDFELWVDDVRVEKKVDPYGFIPFVVFPNLKEPKKIWGLSDLAQIIEPQREFNRAMSQLSRILELSGNPVAVLENVEQSEDIAVKPGAVWNIPEDAKAYLLDLLQGGGVQMHIDYINLLYRTLHDVSESPRAAFGGTEKDLSGVALELELQPLLQKVSRKRAIRTVVYNRRNRMILRLIEKYQGENFGDYHLRVVWSPVLPRDMARLVANEQVMVQGGIHSRRTAMDEVGIKNPEKEFARWLEERDAILKMNRNSIARPVRGVSWERDSEPHIEAGNE